jgi:hypothetical protein
MLIAAVLADTSKGGVRLDQLDVRSCKHAVVRHGSKILASEVRRLEFRPIYLL